MRICVGDLEANGFLHNATRVWCGVFKDIKTKELIKFDKDHIKEMLTFLDTVDVLIMHNGLAYDLPLLRKLYGYEYKGKKVDTLIMSRLLNANRLTPPHCPNKKAPHSIEAWGYRVGRGKPEHEDWLNFSPEMLHRCTEDTEILELVYYELLKEAKGGNWRNAFLLSFKLFENLAAQEEYGWLVDQKYLDGCLSQLEHWVNRIDKVLTPKLPIKVSVNETKKAGEYGYVKKPFLKSGDYSESVKTWYSSDGNNTPDGAVCGPFTRIDFNVLNLNSNQETKVYLLSQGWQPLEWNTNDAGEQTSPKMSKEDPFEGIDGKLGRLVAKRVQIRQRHSILVGIKGLIREDGRIGSVVSNLAVTGRAKHRNIVNIPKPASFYGKQMRKIFTSADGKVLVGTDSDACQVRMLAGRMNDPAYIQALMTGKKEDGTDPHSLTMRIANLDNRDIAKTTLYALLFGAGDAKLGKSAHKPGQGAEVRALLYKGYPGLGILMEKLTKEWQKTANRRFNAKWNKVEYYNGSITGLDGRPIQVPNEHQLLVYLLQSDEAIMMQAAYNKFHKDMEKRGYIYGKQYGVVCWYHDEFTVECDEDIAEDVKKLSEAAIAWAGRYYGITCPHIGDGKIGKNWYDIH